MQTFILVIFLLAMDNILLGQTIIKRKDSVQYVSFPNEIKKNQINYLYLYKLKYPESSKEKDEFFKAINLVTSRIILDKKYINLIFPIDFIEDINRINKGIPFLTEELYSKYASDLTEEEQENLDMEIGIEWPYDSGIIQGYLNKQYYYWLAYLGKEKEYNKDIDYTEFDKAEILEKILEKRKTLITPLFNILDNLVIEISEKNIDFSQNANIPIYISEKSYSQIYDTQNSKIIIHKYNDEEKIYKDRITLIEGRNTEYIREYKIQTQIFVVKSVKDLYTHSQVSKNSEKNGFIKISTLKNFKINELNDKTLKRAVVRKNDSPRNIPDFKKNDTEWVID
jgi:hypothetical protein